MLSDQQMAMRRISWDARMRSVLAKQKIGGIVVASQNRRHTKFDHMNIEDAGFWS